MIPKKFYGVSQSQLSIARYYGGITYNGHLYTYNPVDDTLTLDSELKAEKKEKKRRKRKRRRGSRKNNDSWIS